MKRTFEVVCILVTPCADDAAYLANENVVRLLAVRTMADAMSAQMVTYGGHRAENTLTTKVFEISRGEKGLRGYVGLAGLSNQKAGKDLRAQ